MSDTASNDRDGRFDGLDAQGVLDLINKEGLLVSTLRQVQGGSWQGCLMRPWDARRSQHFAFAIGMDLRQVLVQMYDSVIIAKKIGTWDHPQPNGGGHGFLPGGDYSGIEPPKKAQPSPQHELVQRPVVERVRERQRTVTHEDAGTAYDSGAVGAHEAVGREAVPAIRERVRLQPDAAAVDVSPPPVVRQRVRPT